MAILNLYFSSIPSCKTHMPNGKELNFIGGQFATDEEEEIEFLDAQVKARHPHIYVKKDAATIDSNKLSPLDEIKKKAVEEYLAQQALQQTTESVTDKNAGLGTTASAIASVKSNLAASAAASK